MVFNKHMVSKMAQGDQIRKALKGTAFENAVIFDVLMTSHELEEIKTYIEKNGIVSGVRERHMAKSNVESFTSLLKRLNDAALARRKKTEKERIQKNVDRKNKCGRKSERHILQQADERAQGFGHRNQQENAC